MMKTIEVVNCFGQKVLSTYCGTDETTIDLSSLPNGVYFINVNDDKGSKCSRKVVKE